MNSFRHFKTSSNSSKIFKNMGRTFEAVDRTVRTLYTRNVAGLFQTAEKKQFQLLYQQKQFQKFLVFIEMFYKTS